MVIARSAGLLVVAVLLVALAASPVLSFNRHADTSSIPVVELVKKRKNCTPGYSPCIPNKASDVDCWGGSGNGPRYTARGVTYRVTKGKDRYGLDADRDGWGCER